MIVFDSRNEPVTLARKIGVGGQGDVYEVSGRPDLVAKIYTKNLAGYEDKLAYMIDNPPSGRASSSGHVTLAWPSDLLYDANRRSQFVGFLMPYIKGSCPLLQVFSPRLRSQTLPGFNRRYLFRTARNLASVLSTLHDAGYVVGDLNESNVMVTPSALVTFIDCDSFQVREVREGQIVTYPCTVGKPQYTAPESQGMTFSKQERHREEDFFALTVLIFQLLMEGRLPFSGTWTGLGDPPSIEEKIRLGCFAYADKPTCPITPPPTAPSLTTLPLPVAQLVRKCFIDGYKDRTERPNAHVWHEVLLRVEGASSQPKIAHRSLGLSPSMPPLPTAAPPSDGRLPMVGQGRGGINRGGTRAGSPLMRALGRLSQVSWFDWWVLGCVALFLYAKSLYQADTRVPTTSATGPVVTRFYGDGWLSSGIAWNILEVVLLTVTVGVAVARLRRPHLRSRLRQTSIYPALGVGLLITTLVAFLELEGHLHAFIVTPRAGFFLMFATGYLIFAAGAFQWPHNTRIAWRRRLAQVILVIVGLPAIVGASVFATGSENVPPLGVTILQESATAPSQPIAVSVPSIMTSSPTPQQNNAVQPAIGCNQATVTAGAARSATFAPTKPPSLLAGSKILSVTNLRVRFYAPPWWNNQPERVTDNQYSFTSVPTADYSRWAIYRVPGFDSSDNAGTWLIEASAYMSEIIKTEIVLTNAPRGQTVAGYNGNIGQFHYMQQNGSQIDATLWVGQVGCDRVLLYFFTVPSGDRRQDQAATQVFATIDFNPK